MVEGSRVYRIVETDNFGRDYPNESFYGPLLTKEKAEQVVEIFNSMGGLYSDRYYKVVHEDYKLVPGFEP